MKNLNGWIILVVMLIAQLSTQLFAQGGSSNLTAFQTEDEEIHEVILQAFDLVSKQDYQAALQVVRQAQPPKSPGVLLSTEVYSLKLVEAMVDLAEYDETTDPKSLIQAEKVLKEIVEGARNSEEFQFLKGMSLFQLGYIEELKGNSIRSALKTREAANYLSELETNLDAQALHAIYKYYLGAITSKIPFMGDSRASSLKTMSGGVQNSQYFSNLYRMALVWMYYDAKNYQDGLKLVNQFLKSYPNNRIYLSVRADFYKKLGRISEAYEIYQGVYKSYQVNQSKMSVRQLSALGNLMLLAKSLNKTAELASYTQTFNRYIASFISKMPQSLLDNLVNEGLLD